MTGKTCRYDFDLRTGKSETGLKACTYAVELRPIPDEAEGGVGEEVWVEAPDSNGWELVELRPVSEGMCYVRDIRTIPLIDAHNVYFAFDRVC